jgi:IclR family acetate operon transcriptional repressor
MPGAKERAGSSVQTIDRATAILSTFGGHKSLLGVTEIASATGLSTSTVFRLLSALQHNGFVRQADDRRYVLGPLLLQLAHVAASHTVLRDVAMPTMRRLRDQVRETVGLHELSGLCDRVTVAQAESPLALRRTYTDLGSPIPLPQGAPGKALLAFLPRSLQESMLASTLVRITPSTVTDPLVLCKQLADTRRVGYSISLGERTRSIRSVAAPLWDHTGQPIACLSISAPEMRMELDRCHELGALIRQTAWEISELLGATTEAVQETAAGAKKPGE